MESWELLSLRMYLLRLEDTDGHLLYYFEIVPYGRWFYEEMSRPVFTLIFEKGGNQIGNYFTST